MLLLLSILSPLIPIILGFRKQYNALWIYSICSISNELAIIVIRRMLHIDTAVSSNIFAILEFCLIIIYYKNKVFRSDTLFFLVLVEGLLLFFVTTYAGFGWLKLNRLGVSLYMIHYIILAIAGFYTMLQQQKMLFLETSAFFWVNVTILVYASGAFFLFLSTSHIRNAADREALFQLWNTFFLSLNILKNILLGIALSKREGT